MEMVGTEPMSSAIAVTAEPSLYPVTVMLISDCSSMVSWK